MNKTTAFVMTLLLLPSGVVTGAVDSSYEKMVLDEIEYNRKLKLEEKAVEVLARFQLLGVPQTTVLSSNNTSVHNKTIQNSEQSSTLKSEVK